MNCSPYLTRRLRSETQFLAQHREPHARLDEVHAAIDRAEMELRKIGDEYGMHKAVSKAAYEALDMLMEWRADYLKPVDEEMGNG